MQIEFPGEYMVDGKDVVFRALVDGTSVGCRVSIEGMRDRRNGQGNMTAGDLYETYRRLAETIAYNKLIAGQEPVITYDEIKHA